jgi:hypothetical protein
MIVLTITNMKSIPAIKEEFNTVFPYLKLEFFKLKQEPGNTSKKKYFFEFEGHLKRLAKKDKDGFINITEDMEVNTLEQLFLDQFGLSAQVFRKSGSSWLETSYTVDWSLKRQNEAGQELSQFTRFRGIR